MCGIAGFYDIGNGANLDDLKKITNLLSHRGPDDKGFFFERKKTFNIGLGHRRLSLLDLSPLGHQPMHFENLTLIFNGEVYNFKEIRDSLISHGYSFISNSDTEVILKAFHKWELAALQKFNGMFAIALFNHDTEQLFLIRDRLGVKPLYYYHNENSFVFASELKSIMNYPHFRKHIDWDSLNMYLFHGYITAPHSIFRDVNKLMPGTYLKIEKGRSEIVTYWSLIEKFEQRQISYLNENEILQEFDDLVNNCVNYRMISDAPIGAFLSGGIDSSLVSAVMQKNSSQPVNTFTIGFNEKEFDEAAHAKKVAEYLGTDHHELYLPISDAVDIITRLPQFYDEPFADSSQLPMMLVSQFARKEVTAVLSGDGGDELFCGYPSYETDLVYKKWQHASGLLRKFNRFIPIKPFLLSINPKWDKFFYINSISNITNLEYLRSESHLEKLIKRNSFSLNPRYFELAKNSNNVQEAHMLQDMLTYLPDDIMVKVDRATMCASVEGREPLLDYRLFEFSFNLPHHFKYRGKEKKYLLKQLAYKYIPQKLLDRPKSGFAVPINQWLRRELSFLIQMYLSELYINQQGIFNYEKITELLYLFKREQRNGVATRIIWHIIVFQLWYEKYMK